MDVKKGGVRSKVSIGTAEMSDWAVKEYVFLVPVELDPLVIERV